MLAERRLLGASWQSKIFTELVVLRGHERHHFQAAIFGALPGRLESCEAQTGRWPC